MSNTHLKIMIAILMSASGPGYFFGEPKYVVGEIDFKNPNRDEWRYKEPGFREMSKLVKSVPY